MFQKRTLFVVGAGASCELGLPSGADLKHDIANRLNIKFPDGWQQRGGDSVITDALRRHVASKGERDINPYLNAAWMICRAMPQSLSIDNFIDAHAGDERVEVCGKLAIVQSILAAERNSSLFVRRDETTINFSRLSNAWHTQFFKLATEGARKDAIEAAFENVAFICFNYDRCIEHFLAHAIRNYYGIDEASAQKIAADVKILHPYGVVGNLPWQNPKNAVPFGAELSDVSSAYSQIKTFTERLEDDAAIASLRQEVQSAETIVFLGFAFHRQNMELIAPKSDEPRRVFATGLGMSPADCAAIAREIPEWMSANPRRIQSEVRHDLSCHQLFNEYWRALPR